MITKGTLLSMYTHKGAFFLNFVLLFYFSLTVPIQHCFVLVRAAQRGGPAVSPLPRPRPVPRRPSRHRRGGRAGRRARMCPSGGPAAGPRGWRAASTLGVTPWPADPVSSCCVPTEALPSPWTLGHSFEAARRGAMSAAQLGSCCRPPPRGEAGEPEMSRAPAEPPPPLTLLGPGAPGVGVAASLLRGVCGPHP